MKKTYFASDFHLGLGGHHKSLERERLIIKWLNEIRNDAETIYLMGDIFDFWHEWKTVVPAGFTRFLGKLAELSDSGIKIFFFTGNHDIWTYNYLQTELGMEILRTPQEMEIYGKKFYLAHGDGLGPKDNSFKVLKKIFTNQLFQWAFARLHPNFAVKIAKKWSEKSKEYKKDPTYKHEDEWLVIHSRNMLKIKHYDFFIFGHRHLAINYQLNDSSTFICLGDWIKNFTYAIYDGHKIELCKFN